MHQVSTIQGLMSFFSGLAHRLDTNAIDPAQDDQLMSKQLQKSNGSGPWADHIAGQLDEALSTFP